MHQSLVIIIKQCNEVLQYYQDNNMMIQCTCSVLILLLINIKQPLIVSVVIFKTIIKNCLLNSQTIDWYLSWFKYEGQLNQTYGNGQYFQLSWKTVPVRLKPPILGSKVLNFSTWAYRIPVTFKHPICSMIYGRSC